MIESKIEEGLKEMRAFYRTNTTKDYRYRIHSLKTLSSSIAKHENELMETLATDLHKSHFESFATEISIVQQEIRFQIRHLRKWSRTRRLATPMVFFPSRSYLYKEPYGVVLIIAPWNYPFHLLFNPLVGALAAGNCVMLKTSPLAPATAGVMEKIVSCFPGDYISIWHGHREVNQALLKARFDYIFYTGSPAVGKVVMEAASKHLTPVTLELGGKSPCIVDKDANIRFAARRIAWGKTINAGQTCIAPDYLLVHHSVKEEFLLEYKQAIFSMFGSDPQASPDYPRIVSSSALARLSGYLKEGKIVLGGA
ncbi:MAG TPA: aldehyde dehydrogenase family protein, partial [Bacteroidales bacterium]|nr:aldehyde dehydrogenase family protein [Bacteroidales bacterium]